MTKADRLGTPPIGRFLAGRKSIVSDSIGLGDTVFVIAKEGDFDPFLFQPMQLEQTDLSPEIPTTVALREE